MLSLQQFLGFIDGVLRIDRSFAVAMTSAGDFLSIAPVDSKSAAHSGSSFVAWLRQLGLARPRLSVDRGLRRNVRNGQTVRWRIRDQMDRSGTESFPMAGSARMDPPASLCEALRAGNRGWIRTAAKIIRVRT